MADRGHAVPRAEDAPDPLKYEVAEDIGVDLDRGGDLTTREAGKVGGWMVRRPVRPVERNLARENERRRPWSRARPGLCLAWPCTPAPGPRRAGADDRRPLAGPKATPSARVFARALAQGAR
jgi:hypothetical protein